MDPQEISTALSDYFNSSVIDSFVKWSWYGFIAIIILSVLVILFFWIQFRYKITYPVLHYDTDGKSAQIIKYKTDRARKVTKKGMKVFHLLFKRKYVEPFTEDLIRPGNKINLLRINDDGTWVPMPSILFKSPASFEYLSPFEKKWVMLELEESASANQTPEAARKILTMVIITGVICLVAIIITVYIAMKAPNQAAEAATTIADSLRNVAGNMAGNIPQ